jgi:Flp pilus assembly protein TadG
MRLRNGRTWHEADRGQATVEFAIVLPVVMVVVLAIVQVGLAVRDQLAVELAAREGARAAAVSTDSAGAAAAAASRAVDLPVVITASTDTTSVTVTATYVDDTDMAIIGALLPSITHRASVTMAIEPPDP